MASDASANAPVALGRRLPGGSPRHYGVAGAAGRAAALVGGGALALLGLSKAKSPLGPPLALGAAYLLYRGMAGHDPIAHALNLRSGGDGRILVERTVTVNRPAADLYGAWRNIENLPRIMSHLSSVTPLGDGRSRWVAQGPLGTPVEWEAELVADRPSELIAWRSLPGSTIANDGLVRFRSAPAGRGTEVAVRLAYAPPAGSAGVAVAALFGDAPDQEVREDLRRFKQVMEAGEVATTKGQSSGRAPEYGDAWAQQRERQERAPERDTRPAQPPEREDLVEEADEESFPASDAPSFNIGREDEPQVPPAG